MKKISIINFIVSHDYFQQLAENALESIYDCPKLFQKLRNFV